MPIRSVSVARPSLDDVFMSYTGKTIRDAEATAGDRGRAQMMAFRGGGKEITAMATQVTSETADSIVDLIRVSVPQRSLGRDVRPVSIVWRRELLRFQADRLRIVSALVQPVLFLLVLGTGLSRLAGHGMPPGDYRSARSSTRVC